MGVPGWMPIGRIAEVVGEIVVTDSGRDRDEQGRPRNARPRDGLGRPLAPGATGEPRIPDDLLLPPDESLRYAQELIDSGRPFHAHEVLEASWKAAPDAERDLWQGLAQLAVGLTHLLRGNRVGARSLLERGADRICRYPEAPYGIDISGLIEWSDRVVSALDRPAPPSPMQLRRSPAPQPRPPDLQPQVADPQPQAPDPQPQAPDPRRQDSFGAPSA